MDGDTFWFQGKKQDRRHRHASEEDRFGRKVRIVNRDRRSVGDMLVAAPELVRMKRTQDVLAYAEHCEYIAYPAIGNLTYREGIAISKPAVRIFKNIRNRIIDDGRLREGIAPSYFLEGML
ncbi:hypothetical protein ACYJL1_16845 (plasmid) [Phyllobacterium sp. K27]